MSLSRHWSVLKEAWAAESKRRRAGVKEWRDKEFLPAALEIAETPPSPIGRGILWTIIAAAVTALLWSIFSHVDVVAARGGWSPPAGCVRSRRPRAASSAPSMCARDSMSRPACP